MTSGINSINQSQVAIQKAKENDTSIHYIGHGQLEKSAASTSVLHVIGHELDHVAEFKSKAIRDRAEIRSLDMKIDYELRDGKMVAVGGKTTITTTEPSDIPTSKTAKKAIPAITDDIVDIHISNNNVSSEDGITIQESKLKEKLEQIESEIDMSMRKTYYSNPNFKTPEDIKKEARELELRETKSRIAVQLDELRNKEISEKGKSLWQTILKLQSNFRETLVKLGLMQSTGHSLDTTA